MNRADALVHLAWHRNGDKRRLIFGWVELLPVALPPLPSHPFIPLRLNGRKDGGHIYVARFPMSATSAAEWFEACIAGKLTLPSHPEKPTRGDSSELTDPPTRMEPSGGGDLLAMDLPFLPAIHSAIHIRALYGAQDGELFEIINGDAANWLNQQLFFDLREYPEYIGALVRTRYDEDVRDVDVRLVPQPNGDAEQIRIGTWPDTQAADLELFAIDQRPIGVTSPQRIRVGDRQARLEWHRRVEHSGLALFHPSRGLCWWMKPLPFLRSVSLNVTPIGREKHIELKRPYGRTESFQVAERVRSQPTLIGDRSDSESFASRHYQAQAHRARRETSSNLGLQWFDDVEAARRSIRSIVGSANHRLWIIDPYSAGLEIVRFVLAVTVPDLDIEIVTSAEHLRTAVDGSDSTEIGDALEQVLQQVKAQNLGTPSVKVMPGERAPIHDRFLVVDDQVWLSGNSLNAIGERASVLMKVPDPSDVLPRLERITSTAIPFEQWIAGRRASRSKKRTSLLRWLAGMVGR